MLDELLAMQDPSLIEGLEGDQRLAQQLLGDRDVAECLVEQNAIGLLDQVEVCSQAILLVLLLESLEIAEVGMDTYQDLEQPGRLRRPPPLLAADDLVAAGYSWGGFHLQHRLVAAGFH